MRGDLYDIIGHLKLINGHNLHDFSDIDIAGDSQKGRVSVHLQPRDGPILNVYLWDQAAAEFRMKLKGIKTAPSVLLVTTVNPKKIGGRLSLATMSSSRVFFDAEVLPGKEYLTWLETQDTKVATIDASQVAKVETVTIGEIQEFLRTQPAQKATFNCIATIDQLKLDCGWYYIGCTDCNTKVSKSDSSLVCYKCENQNAMAVIKFRLEYFVHDKESEATFVFLDEAAGQLIGRKAAELIDEHVEVNGDIVQSQDFPAPTCLSDVFKQTHMFEVKLSEYNFRATRQTFTISKVTKSKTAGDCVTSSLHEPLESSPTETNVERCTSNAETSGSSSLNQNDYGSGETAEQCGKDSKRPRLST